MILHYNNTFNIIKAKLLRFEKWVSRNTCYFHILMKKSGLDLRCFPAFWGGACLGPSERSVNRLRSRPGGLWPFRCSEIPRRTGTWLLRPGLSQHKMDTALFVNQQLPSKYISERPPNFVWRFSISDGPLTMNHELRTINHNIGFVWLCFFVLLRATFCHNLLSYNTLH